MSERLQSTQEGILHVQYALAKQVPDIKLYARFETRYGHLGLTLEESEKVGALVEKLLEKRLKKLRKS